LNAGNQARRVLHLTRADDEVDRNLDEGPRTPKVRRSPHG